MKALSQIKEKIAAMNLAQKLVSGFGLICCFILLNSILTIAIHFYTRDLQDTEANEYLPVKANLEEMMSRLTESRRLVVNWVFVDHQPNTPDKVKLAAIVNTDFDAVMNDVKAATAEWEDEFTDTLAIVEEKVHAMFDMERTVMNNLSTFDSY
ncbi:hypothetical protein NP234_24150, partial [Salmonella enterica]|nr:hypothetical protein [Salmonella enterica]